MAAPSALIPRGPLGKVLHVVKDPAAPLREIPLPSASRFSPSSLSTAGRRSVVVCSRRSSATARPLEMSCKGSSRPTSPIRPASCRAAEGEAAHHEGHEDHEGMECLGPPTSRSAVAAVRSTHGHPTTGLSRSGVGAALPSCPQAAGQETRRYHALRRLAVSSRPRWNAHGFVGSTRRPQDPCAAPTASWAVPAVRRTRGQYPPSAGPVRSTPWFT